MHNDRQLYFSRLNPSQVFPKLETRWGGKKYKVRTTSRTLETRAVSNSKLARYIEFIEITADNEAESGLETGWYFNYIGNDFEGQFGPYPNKSQALKAAKEDFDENFDPEGERSTSRTLETRAVSNSISNLNRAIDDMRGTLGA